MPDRPTAGELEQRSAPADAPAPTIEGNTLHGLIPYSVESRNLGGWTEQLAPGCLTNAARDDLVATLNHDVSRLLGRYPTTLSLEDRDEGVAWSCELPNGPTGQDVREAVRRGDLKATSWRMVVGRDSWRGSLRTVEEIRDLRDVAVVTTSSYPTVAELRAAPEDIPAPAADNPAEREEEDMPENRNGGGGLQVEDRAADAHGTVEERTIEAMRGVPAGESRALTEVDNAAPVTPPELSTMLWDRLRDMAVVLASGVPVITTDRESIKWPRLVGDMTADFYDELEEIVESDPEFGEFDVKPKAIKALARGSAEAFEDSDPDLLQLLQAHMQTILSLKLDRELLVGNAVKGFKGLTNATGVTALDAAGDMDNYDLMLRAAGVLAGQFVPGPYVAVGHPWVATNMSLWKDETGSQRPLERPEGVPPMYLTTQVGRNATAGTSTVIVYAPAQLAVVRRRDVTVEVDRSQEFTKDAVLLRGKVRATLFLPYTEAVVKITNVPAPDPAVTTP